MIGLVVVAHGGFSASLVENVTHVLGAHPAQLKPVGVLASDAPAHTREQIERAIAEVDRGDGVLVLSDMCGATPCNLARRAAGHNVEVVSGANLPMLLRVLSYRDLPLARLVEKAISGGREGVMLIPHESSHATSAN